jgi:hypothetical protein
MSRWVTGPVIALALGAAVFAACSKNEEMPAKEYLALGEFVQPEDSMPRVRYFDTNLVSINDRCAVRKVKLNPKMPPVYVNGQPVGFS